jgi:hypothetical protein
MPLDRMTDCVESVLVTVVTSFSLRKQLKQINAYAIERRCVSMLRGPSREYVDLGVGFESNSAAAQKAGDCDRLCRICVGWEDVANQGYLS